MSKEALGQFFKSKLFAGIIVGVCGMLVVICIFEAGVIIGYHEAEFSSHWGENYGRNFANSSSSNPMGFPDMRAPTPDGILGKIVSISPTSASSTTIILSNNLKPEEKILIDSGTIIRDHENTLSASELTMGAYIVVLGIPNDQGEIQANLIRVVPAP